MNENRKRELFLPMTRADFEEYEARHEDYSLALFIRRLVAGLPLRRRKDRECIDGLSKIAAPGAINHLLACWIVLPS